MKNSKHNRSSNDPILDLLKFKFIWLSILMLHAGLTSAQSNGYCIEENAKFTGVAATTLCEQYGGMKPDIAIGQGTATTHTSQLGNTYTGDIFIAGDLIVDNQFTFLNCTVKIAPGVTIFINDPLLPMIGTQLTLDNSKLFACNNLWKGISLEDDANIVSKNNTIIEDAEMAIAANNSLNNQLFISHTTFNRDRIGIRLNAPNNSIAPPVFVIFNNNNFTCTAPLNGTVDGITFAGIATINVPIAVGGGALNQANSARFSDLENGIFSLAGTTSIIGRGFRFERIKKDGILLREGTLELRVSAFRNCEKRGIRMLIANRVDVRSTDFRFDWDLPAPTSSNVYVTGARIHGFGLNAEIIFDVNVWAADLTAEMTNIRGLHLGGGIMGAGTDIHIFNSEFSMLSENSSGIFLDGFFPASSTTRIEVNTFACAAPSSTTTEAILMEGDKNNVHIFANTFNERSDESKTVGIRASSSMGVGNRIEGNVFERSNGLFFEFVHNGCFLTTNNFTNTTICSNRISSADGESAAFAFDGNNIGTILTRNIINGTGIGVDILPSSLIGPQPHRGNEWHPIFIQLFFGIYIRSEIHARCQGCDQFQAGVNKFTVHTDQSVWDPILLTYTSFSEYHTENVFPDNNNEFFEKKDGSPVGACEVQVAGLVINELDKSISNGAFQPPVGYPAMGWLAKRHLFKKLKDAPALVGEYPYFAPFLANNQSSTVGQFYEVGEKIGDAFHANGDLLQEVQTIHDQSILMLDSLIIIDSLITLAANDNEVGLLVQNKLQLLRAIIGFNSDLDSLNGVYEANKPMFLQSAYNLNESIQVNELYEINEKAVNRIYLQSLLQPDSSLTENRINELILIAQQCPEDGGMAIGRALGMLPDCIREGLAICEPDTLQLMRPHRDTVFYNGQNILASSDLDGSNMVYPNPAGQIFYIKHSGEKIGEISIIDLSGKVVFEQTMNENTNSVQEINHNLANGVYFIKIQMRDGRSVMEKVSILSN